ncbi:glycosyltransferase [Anianabacter salinae]|uniref:glycosyltransferase n=1 Tax=Anianabacter salinae TaxID=2851023 RepID=UPI00225E1545|nr:glycosyltransferase family 2 protein [Anianabacter salinae]MBV0913629.1 glycosyltransferase family 2 protein [Anianabacter salinae]
MTKDTPITAIPELTIVVPTYNERDNVRPLVALLADALHGIRWEVVFVDDDSPDGTAAEVASVGQEDGRVRVLHRIGRRGLAGACIEGMLSAISPVVAVIDADLQHDERILPAMFDKFRDPGTDLVIGTRNAEGGSAGSGLSPLRKWGSDMATGLARRFLRITATDPMSGFFMVRRASFNQIVTGLQTDGFKILADMLSASGGRWGVEEVGYTFRERQHGESKMDAAVTLEFLGLVVARMTGGLLPIRFILFGMVGVSGIFVQLLFVRLGLAADLAFGWAQVAGVFAAMTTNFFLNNALTYRDRALRGWGVLRGLLSFYAVCAIGAVMNVGVAEAVYSAVPQWALASTAGAIVGALWNFVASSFATWRAR